MFDHEKAAVQNGDETVSLTKWQKAVLRGYPDAADFGVSEGMRKEDFNSALQHAGDGLFVFLMREMGDDCDSAEEALRRLHNAVDDIHEVIGEILSP